MPHRERGDTLVEVMIATAILASAVVGGISIMNFGFGIVLNAIERTQVQASINSQIALLQYARDDYVQSGRQAGTNGGAYIWNEIVNVRRYPTTTYNRGVCNAAGAPSTTTANRPFYIRDDTTTLATPVFPGSALVGGVPAAATAEPSPGRGLWIEAVRRPANSNYIDFYIKACWNPPSGTQIQEARSVMRLYVP